MILSNASSVIPGTPASTVHGARLRLIRPRITGEVTTAGFANVRVDGFTGLLTTFCRENGILAIVKGLRAVSDFDYELQMAQMNASLTEVETVFVPTSPEYSFLASSLIKEVAMLGGDVSTLVPGFVHTRLQAKLAEPGTG